MRTLIVVVIVTATLLCAQAYRDLLLPQARSVTGIVSRVDGSPLNKARVDHSDTGAWTTVETDATGGFELKSRAPAIVIRKAGFRSQWMRIADLSKIQITLQPAEGTPQIRACSRTEPCETINGWGAQFCFPKVEGVTAGQQGQDIDYGIRFYLIGKGHGAIQHGSGGMWSFGLPSDTDVWRSTEYQEKIFGIDPLIAIDAKGRTADGKLWRNLGKFGESASYRDASEADARLLDRVLDGVCIRSSQR